MRSGKSAHWAILPVCTVLVLAITQEAFAQGKTGQKKGDRFATPRLINGEPVLLEGFRAKKEPVRAGSSSSASRGGIGTNCCSTGHGPGCEDAAIEACVCALDSFCCNTDWDGVCVDNVDDFGCATCLAPVTNDDCVDAIALPGDGSFPFSNAGSTNDGPALPAVCDEGFGLGKGADIWYTLTALCDAPITISLCDADYDARMSVYNDDTCPATNANFEECDDDGCGAIGGPSELTFNGVAGTTYLIRIGGFAGPDGIGDEGSGNIVITGAGSGAATDCNSNSVPDGCETDETTDCDGNGVLDECELGSLPDCNINGTPDACETSNDCNDNGTPDDCDIAGGTSSDADGGGLPDECEEDCNNNGVPDGLDIVGGTSVDCQPDGVPDECQLGTALRGLDPTDSLFCQQGIQDDNGVGAGLLFASGSSAPEGFVSAENVTLATDANINRIDWQVVFFGGASDCPNPDSVDIFIFSSVAGAPGSLLATYTDVPNTKNLAARPPILGTNPVYDVSGTLDPPFALSAGTEVWIAIVGDATAGGCAGTYGWVASDAVPPGDGGSFQDVGAGFVFQDADLAICVFSGASGADCNGNGIPDDCDIAGGADDCNSNSTPDECEFIDCDNNSIFDECEILADPSLDLAGDADGSDCADPDGVLDVCQDCNNNTVADCADLLPGTDNVKDDFVSGLGVPIPDCDTATDQPVTHSIVFTECGPVDDLDVAFQADHTFVGDLIVTLEHEDTGTTVTLMHRVNANNAPTCANGGSAAPFGNGNDNVDVIFDDEAAAPIETQAGSLANGESFRPSAEAGEAQFSTLLSDFDGEDKCGTWTISVLDNGAADTGTFQGWGLIFTNGGEIPPFSQDCNTNGTPDECDIAAGTSGDCNLNLIPDECEADCNANGTPDDCDVLSGASADCDGNFVPDECEPDCNQNGTTDACDILAGDSDDCNKDGVPDECSGDPGGLKITNITAGIAPPDGAGTFVCDTFNVTDSAILEDVDIDVQVTHTFLGDLIINVEHNGTTVELFNRACGTQDNMDVIFDEDGDPATPCGDLPNGPRVPSSDSIAGGAGLAAFNGMDKQGDWTICISDNAGLDTGTLDSWSLHLTNQGDAQVGLIDCNENGLLDECDILFGLSEDCNDSAVPDECEACVEQTFADEDFCEGLPTGWTVSGSAHVTDACAQPDPCDECEGTQQWVYFGRDAVCQKADAGDGQVSGVLTSPPIDLTGFTKVTLEYCSIYNGERGQAPGGIDAAWVAVNGTIVDDVSFLHQNVDVWETRQVDLTPFVAQGVVTITWNFDTADSINNAFLGWQVDQISIEADDTDCNDNGTIDQCDVRDGFSFDFNKNFCPDECEDCNGNGVLDDFDVQPGQVKFYQNNFPAGLAIPDADSSGVVSVINVAEFGPVVDLDLALEIEHTNNGDLEVTLEHLGVSATLISRPGGGANDNDGLDVNLNDEAQVSIATADSGGGVLTGQFRPSPDALSVFDGMPKSNDWVLTVRDLNGGNVGQILSWQLRMANAPPVSDDCNFNGVPDECEQDDDCNNSGVLDACELADNDCNANGIPDECDLAGNDCNANGTPDDCETDCDTNGTPDDCDIAGGADDCNVNGIPDVCEFISGGTEVFNASPVVAVPDDDPAGVTSIITVPNSFNIQDVNVGMDVTHTFFGDFCVTLTHPSGSPTVQLIARPGADNGMDVCHQGSPFGCSSNEWSLELDDEGADGPIEDNCGAASGDPTPSGSFTPFEALDAFDGLDAAGDWTITVSDNGAGDTGVFNSWSLTFGSDETNDCDGNGVLDECDPDSDGDGIPDACDCVPCQHTINLIDSFGDGWDGASIDVLVNGVIVLDDVTAVGSGSSFTFDACTGDAITTDYTPGAFENEHTYEIVDGVGLVIGSDGPSPGPGIAATANCDCPACDHTIDLIDSFGDGWDGASIDVLVNGVIVLDDVTAVGSGSSFTFSACTGDAITTDYTPGAFENEHTYDVRDGNGTIIGSDGPNPGPGIAATGNCEPAAIANDDCAGAQALSVPDSVSGDTSPAAPDTAPTCGTTDGTAGAVWYSVIGTGQQITASLCGSSFDTKIRVYTDGCGTLTCVAGNDDSCSTQSEVTWCSDVGVEYLILVHGFSGNAGAFTLDISDAGACPAPLANDFCPDATVVPDGALPFTDTGVDYGLATNDLDISCNSGSNTETRFGVWYTYTPSVDCTLTVDIVGSPFQDTAHAIFDGTDCNTLNEIDCSDPQSSSTAITAGTQYWILVGRWSAFSDPSGTLDITFDCPSIFRGMPDFDLDGDIDLADFAQLQICMASPGSDPICDMADVNLNGSVDLGDFGEFSKFLHGPDLEKPAKELVAP